MRISDWSSDVCSSDLEAALFLAAYDADFAAAHEDRIARRQNMLATALLDFQRRIGGDQIEHLHRIGGNQAAGARDPHRRRGNRGIGGARQSAQCSFGVKGHIPGRSEEHTSELKSLMRISYAVFCLKKN